METHGVSGIWHGNFLEHRVQHWWLAVATKRSQNELFNVMLPSISNATKNVPLEMQQPSTMFIHWKNSMFHIFHGTSWDPVQLILWILSHIEWNEMNSFCVAIYTYRYHENKMSKLNKSSVPFWLKRTIWVIYDRIISWRIWNRYNLSVSPKGQTKWKLLQSDIHSKESR